MLFFYDTVGDNTLDATLIAVRRCDWLHQLGSLLRVRVRSGRAVVRAPVLIP
jgi:hypothetical protein